MIGKKKKKINFKAIAKKPCKICGLPLGDGPIKLNKKRTGGIHYWHLSKEWKQIDLDLRLKFEGLPKKKKGRKK